MYKYYFKGLNITSKELKEFKNILIELKTEIYFLRELLDDLKREKLIIEKLLSPREFCDITCISYRKVLRMIKEKTIPVVKVGSKYLINYRDALERMTVKAKKY